MRLLFWRKNKQIDAFAQAAANDLFSYVRPDLARQHIFGGGPMPKGRKIKTERKFNDIILQIKRYSEANALGVYGKARLQQKFNRRLEELGYPTEVVNKLSESILVRNV